MFELIKKSIQEIEETGAEKVLSIKFFKK